MKRPVAQMAHLKKEKSRMDLEITITIPGAGTAMTIPTRSASGVTAVAGGRVVESNHVAAVDDLRSLELDRGVLSSS
jgi:hypothetical protein